MGVIEWRTEYTSVWPNVFITEWRKLWMWLLECIRRTTTNCLCARWTYFSINVVLSLRLLYPWRRGHYVCSERQKPLTQRENFIFQTTWILYDPIFLQTRFFGRDYHEASCRRQADPEFIENKTPLWLRPIKLEPPTHIIWMPSTLLSPGFRKLQTTAIQWRK